jgi:hypothetical protein
MNEDELIDKLEKIHKKQREVSVQRKVDLLDLDEEESREKLSVSLTCKNFRKSLKHFFTEYQEDKTTDVIPKAKYLNLEVVLDLLT